MKLLVAILFVSVSLWAEPLAQKSPKKSETKAPTHTLPKFITPITAPPGFQRKFKITTDVLWHYPPQPSLTSFRNLYALFTVDLFPLPNVQLSFEVSPNSRFYEIDWNATETLQIRIGRIWIPYDDMGPHQSFGGVANLTALGAWGIYPFLPDLWSELGVALKLTLNKTDYDSSEAHFYVVNGIADKGIDPFNQVSAYPNFGPNISSNDDNNNDKAFGGRLKIVMDDSISYGFSFYSGQYTPLSVSSARVTMLGMDTQILFTDDWKVKAGYSIMLVGLQPGSQYQNFRRAGAYASVLHQISDQFKVSLSGTATQPDDRLTDASDRTLVGLTVAYQPMPNVETTFLYFRDLNRVAIKTLYDSIGFRFFMVF